jgi:hypothetical protein
MPLITYNQPDKVLVAAIKKKIAKKLYIPPINSGVANFHSSQSQNLRELERLVDFLIRDCGDLDCSMDGEVMV